MSRSLEPTGTFHSGRIWVRLFWVRLPSVPSMIGSSVACWLWFGRLRRALDHVVRVPVIRSGVLSCVAIRDAILGRGGTRTPYRSSVPYRMSWIAGRAMDEFEATCSVVGSRHQPFRS